MLNLVSNMGANKRKLPTKDERESGARLRRYCIEHMNRLGIDSQEKLGGLVGGYSKAAVNQWFNTGKIHKDNVARLARVFGQPETELWSVIRGAKISAQLAANEDQWDEVRGFAQAVGLGHGAEAQEYAEINKLHFRHGSLQKKRLRPLNLSVFEGKGDSMRPRINPGDAILFDQSDTRVADEKIYVIMWRGEYNAKRAEIIDEVVYFKADNPTGDHNWRKPKRMDAARDPITVIGRVRWIGSWED